MHTLLAVHGKPRLPKFAAFKGYTSAACETECLLAIMKSMMNRSKCLKCDAVKKRQDI